MAKILRFIRRQKAWLPRWRSRRASAPWRSLAALLGVAGVLWYAAELHPDVMGGNGASVAKGRRGTFVLCGGARQESCVIDGDTIRYGGVKIRLEDIDAPEIFSPKCASEAALGRRATQRLLELMNAGPFRMIRRGGRDEDRYGRKLRIIERAGRSVGAVLVAEGLARPWDGARRSWCNSRGTETGRGDRRPVVRGAW